MTSSFGKIGKAVPRPQSPYAALGLQGQAFDAFSNPAARTGFGTPSLVEGTEYNLVRWTNNYWLLLTLYRNHWISRRIVDTAAQDMVRAWPRITSVIPPDDIKTFDRCLLHTQTKTRILETLKWSRLYGGAGALIVIDGHEDILDEPLEWDDVQPGSYRGIIPFDRWTGISPGSEICSDLNRPADFGLPESYRVQAQGARDFQVHASRILRFCGPDVPSPEKQASMYWGISVLEPVYEELRKRDNLSWSIINLTFRAQILALTNPQLSQMMSGLGASQTAQQQYWKTLEAQNELLSNQSMLVLPKDGAMQTFQCGFGGLADIYAQIQLDIAGAAQIPVARLFGRTITGLSQSNDADERMYEERIQQEQEQMLRPQLDKLYPVIFMSEFGKIPDDLDFDFPSVRVLTEEEKTNLAKDNTAAVIEAFNAGLISQQTSLRELQQTSQVTGIFTNISQEDIQAADDEVSPKGELSLGDLPGFPKQETPRNVLEMPRAAAKDQHPVEYQGIPLTIEFPKDSYRTLYNDAGEIVYKRELRFDYGFINDTIGRDGDEIDVILGPSSTADNAFVVDMIDLGPDVDKREDEDKVLLGFESESAARRAFLSMYPPSFFGGLRTVPLNQFKAEWLGQGDGWETNNAA